MEAAKPLGPIAYILKLRVTLLRDLGPAQSPFNAFLTLQGLETLPLRMREHSRNASRVADYLAGHPAVARVIHPAHHKGVAAERTAKYLPHGHGGLVGFELKGGAEAGRAFIDRAAAALPRRQYRRLPLARDPPGQHDPQPARAEEQLATGVSPGYVRLSVGIEHIDDILADLDQALAGRRGEAGRRIRRTRMTITRRAALASAARPSVRPHALAAGNPVVLGVSGPLTGPNAQYGAQWKQGFDLALERDPGGRRQRQAPARLSVRGQPERSAPVGRDRAEIRRRPADRDGARRLLQPGLDGGLADLPARRAWCSSASPTRTPTSPRAATTCGATRVSQADEQPLLAAYA